jgi:hypothetical protein
MADLTADAPLRFRYPNNILTEMWPLDNSTAQVIYKGQPVILDVSVDTTKIRGFVDATVVAITDVFVGIALGRAEIATDDVEGTIEVEVLTHGEVGFKSSVFTDADVGDTVYMSDSGTLSATSLANPVIGVLRRVVDGYAYVMINPDGGPTICTTAGA